LVITELQSIGSIHFFDRVGSLMLCFVRFHLIIIFNRGVFVIWLLELLGFEAIIINDLIFLVSLNLISLAVKIVALQNLYLIITYNWLLFAAAHLQGAGHL
jgi:hypothetical protein